MATHEIDPNELTQLLTRLNGELSRRPSAWINSQGSITTQQGRAETWRVQEFSVGEWYAVDMSVLKDLQAFLRRLEPPALTPEAAPASAPCDEMAGFGMR